MPPGASVVLHSACAEPRFLSGELARIAHDLEGVRVYTMMSMEDAPYAAPELAGHLAVHTFFPGRALRQAVNAGRASIVRAPLSAIPGLFRNGTLRAEVLLLQVSPPDQDGRMSLGISVDYMPAVLELNPLVVAEINSAMPRTCGTGQIHLDQVDYFVEVETPVQTLAAAAPDRVDTLIAWRVAELIGNGSVIQAGIGTIPDLVLANLGHLIDLGIHTGIITDAMVPLIEQGAVTNATKKSFAAKSVTTMAAGTRQLYDFLDDNPDIEFHPCAVTHDADLLAGIDGLCAINSALQIDLTGRATAEYIDGRAISSVGGLRDFTRGASRAKGGRSIIGLRSASRDGRHSNILASLPDAAPVTVGASDIGFVVTEYGVARIQGLGAEARARALVGIAHPDHRADLRKRIELGL